MPEGIDLAARIVVCAILLSLSALFAGLTLGVMSLDPNQLEIVRAAGSPRDREYASTILPVRKAGNLLLCTLLLGNVAVNSLSSILLADLTSGLVGFIVSTFLIVILGEIIPQAACSRHALRLGAMFVPVVKVFMVLMYPVSKPISMILDRALGEEMGIYYTRQEFHKLLTMHMATNRLEPREVAIMSGAMTYREKRVRDVMTPAERIFGIRSSDHLDYALLAQIYRAGYSRIPVWNDELTAMVGLLYAKDLVLVEPRARAPVITIVHFFRRQHINELKESDTLETALRMFTQTRQHFAVVRGHAPTDTITAVAPPIVGVISMEDIVEAIIGEALVDEYDAYRDHPVTTAADGAAHGHQLQVEAGLRRLHEAVAAAAGVNEDDEHHGINNKMGTAEIAGVAAHLLHNVKAFRSEQFTLESVKRLVQHCHIVDAVSMRAQLKSGPVSDGTPAAFGLELIPPIFGRPAALADDGPDVIVMRHQPCDACYLILEGQVTVTAGEDGLSVTLSAWDVIADRALTHVQGGYVADFTARACSPVVRCLRITVADFEATRTGTFAYQRLMSRAAASVFADMPGSAAQRAAAAALHARDTMSAPAPKPPVGVLAEPSLWHGTDGEEDDLLRPPASIESWISQRGTLLPPSPFSAAADAALPPMPPPPRHPQAAHAAASSKATPASPIEAVPRPSDAGRPSGTGDDVWT